MSLFKELSRRNVFRVAVAYVVGSWVILQVSALLLEIFDAPESIMRVIVVLLIIGFVFSIGFAWAFEVTPEGIKREADLDRNTATPQQTAKRLDLLTIVLVIAAIGLLIVDRTVPSDPAPSPTDAANTGDRDRIDIRLAQQILEVDRLRDLGESVAAFALATEIESLIPNEAERERLWEGISWQTDIESEPPGARVFRQEIDAPEDSWDDLGTTPLTGIRFANDQGYRLRFELAGHRSVELLPTAIRKLGWGDYVIPASPAKLDPVDVLPDEMVRIPGFSHDLVDYADFFMDRFEVTNREFAQFVKAGGYETPEYWQQPFLKNGQELSWEQAMAEFVDITGRPGPASWTGGAYPDDKGDYPVNGVSWYEAAAYAAFSDKQLPTIAHVDATRKLYIVDAGQVLGRSNLGGDGPWPVGHNRAMSTYGVYDMDGNVREWLWNEAGQGAHVTKGAAWTDAPFHVTWQIPRSNWDRDLTNGFRLIRSFDSAEKLARLRQPEKPLPHRDLMSEAPPSDEEIRIYKRMFAYDAFPLNAEIVASDSFDHWTRIHVEFDLPYGERGGAYLYIPVDARPPYETVVYWGGSNVLNIRSVDEEYIEAFNFIIRSGRAVAQPILKGMFHRSDEAFRNAMNAINSSPDFEPGTAGRDLKIKWIQDLMRTIDYLDTRDDIRSDTYGFYGLSFGAGEAPILLAMDDRIGPAVLKVGGLDDVWRELPETDPLTYIRAVQNPVLMLNGEFDIVRPLETSQKPMFELLGTDPAHKKHYLAPAGHNVPRDETIRETLAWFDRYLSGKGD